MERALIALSGIAINFVLFFIANKLGIPLYFDTIGTMFVAAVCGVFPGVAVALTTNILCSLFMSQAIFYSSLNILIAIVAYKFFKRARIKKVSSALLFISVAAFIGGVLGGVFQWLLLGEPQFATVRDTAKLITSEDSSGFFFAFLAVNFALNIIDKTICFVIAYLIFSIIRKEKKEAIRNSGFMQRGVLNARIEDEKGGRNDYGLSLQTRMALMFVITAAFITLVISVVSVRIYTTSLRAEYKQNAINAAKLAAASIDADKIDTYLVMGHRAEGYNETEQRLTDILENSNGVQYLYALKIERDGCHFIFDIDTEDTEGYEPGEVVPFDKEFEEFKDELIAGNEIKAVESDGVFGWLLTIYCPVKNDEGRTVCYTGADISLVYFSGYVKEYIVKILLIFSGFFLVVVIFSIWISRMRLVYPIKSMVRAAEDLSFEDLDQDEMDKNVGKLKALDINTGDEVEQLYDAICRMAVNNAEQTRRIRYFARANEKMQNGLIVTMANMVESRDSDTGAHVQKTAAYVRIILEGLKRKGYYPEKLNDKYIAEVEMSAPLHDVGKINVSDTILNKPGKLTDEEYEIMKTHTTAGKHILEDAISTVQGESYLKEARNMAAYHHERWDGKGYPEKLHGEVIPLAARVMAVADVFDALTSPRVYKPAFPLEKALAILQEGSGTQFDPKCVEVFMENLDEVKKVLKKFQNA